MKLIASAIAITLMSVTVIYFGVDIGFASGQAFGAWIIVIVDRVYNK